MRSGVEKKTSHPQTNPMKTATLKDFIVVLVGIAIGLALMRAWTGAGRPPTALVEGMSDGAGPPGPGPKTCNTTSWDLAAGPYTGKLMVLSAYDAEEATYLPSAVTAAWRDPTDDRLAAIVSAPAVPKTLWSSELGRFSCGLPLADTVVTLPPSSEIAPRLADFTLVWALSDCDLEPGTEVTLFRLAPSAMKLAARLVRPPGGGDAPPAYFELAYDVASVSGGASETQTARAPVSGTCTFLALSRSGKAWTLRQASGAEALASVQLDVEADLGEMATSVLPAVLAGGAGSTQDLRWFGWFASALTPEMLHNSLQVQIDNEVTGRQEACRLAVLADVDARRRERVERARYEEILRELKESGALCIPDPKAEPMTSLDVARILRISVQDAEALPDVCGLIEDPSEEGRAAAPGTERPSESSSSGVAVIVDPTADLT